MISVISREENIVGNGENAGNQHFLQNAGNHHFRFFQQCFLPYYRAESPF